MIKKMLLKNFTAYTNVAFCTTSGLVIGNSVCRSQKMCRFDG